MPSIPLDRIVTWRQVPGRAHLAERPRLDHVEDVRPRSLELRAFLGEHFSDHPHVFCGLHHGGDDGRGVRPEWVKGHYHDPRTARDASFEPVEVFRFGQHFEGVEEFKGVEGWGSGYLITRGILEDHPGRRPFS